MNTATDNAGTGAPVPAGSVWNRAAGSLRLAGATAGLGLLMLLGACGTSIPEMGAADGCPRVGVLAEASRRVTFLEGYSQDVTDVLYEAEVNRVAMGCKARKDRVDMDFDVDLSMRQGPAGLGTVSPPQPLRYFIAVTHKKRVLLKNVYETTVTFEGLGRVAVVEESINDLKVSLPEGAAVTDLDVLVGFDLTRDQVEYNRQNLRP